MSHVTRVRGRAGILTGTSLLLLSGAAFAQEAAPAAATPAAEPAAAPATETAQAEETAAPAPAAEPAAEPAPEAPPMEAAATTDASAEAAPMEAPPTEAAPADAAPEEEESPLSFGMFADAYWGLQTADPGTPVPYHRAYAWQSADFKNENGFSLSFVGVDATYDGGEFAATGSLRFGPSVPIFYANQTMSLVGLDNLLQGYVSWRPIENLNIDLGQFGTIFGAEVAESWNNLNYTRGGLYYAMQPFWHTGLRASYEFSDAFGLTGMLVNGVNNISENKSLSGDSGQGGNDVNPSAALQARVVASDEFSLAAGGLFSFDGADDSSSFDRFFDLVATLSLGDFTAIFNADYNIAVEAQANGDDANWFGLSLAGGYQLTDMFGVALRGEYLSDSNNVLNQYADSTGAAADSVKILTGTLTLDLKPIPDHDNLVIRWDNRIENASENIYFGGSPPTTPLVDPTDPTAGGGDPISDKKIWFGSTVGVVVHTD